MEINNFISTASFQLCPLHPPPCFVPWRSGIALPPSVPNRALASIRMRARDRNAQNQMEPRFSGHFRCISAVHGSELRGQGLRHHGKTARIQKIKKRIRTSKMKSSTQRCIQTNMRFCSSSSSQYVQAPPARNLRHSSRLVTALPPLTAHAAQRSTSF